MIPHGIWALIAVACAAAGYVGGRYVQAPQIQERVVTRDVVREVKAKARVVYRTRIIAPDGTITVRSSSHTQENSKSDGEVSTQRVTTARPDWRVGALVGATLTPPALPLSGPLTVGLQVERRILGPFSVGVWGLTSGQAGVSVSGEF